MYDNASGAFPPAIYHLKFQSRCIAAQLGDSDRNRFLVGTINLREENELHLIEFNEESNEITCERVYSHPNEIWHISPCPSNPALVFTVYNTGTEYKAGLWKLKGLDDAQDTSVTLPAEEVLSLNAKSEVLHSVLWNLAGKPNNIITVDDASVRVYSLDASSSKCTEQLSVGVQKNQKFWTGTWDLHHPDQLLTSSDTTIRAWDLRTLKPTQTIEQAHSIWVRDLDYNPNKPYVFASGGDDTYIRFWDLRRPGQALAELQAHNHWVWQVRYNRFHDQLLLSSSTDCGVTLWKAASVSSMPVPHTHDDPDEGPTSPKSSPTSEEDGVVSRYDKHDESVYSVAWCSSDAWSFASVSYDGRVVINHVPQQEKYKIIL
mmetsp:Transcript_19738/g.33910  ORF Transcript_19738/g.33910 Transcript_19738/m.33910 type:complete len:374 (-) Transcript_19738:58-1179(-)